MIQEAVNYLNKKQGSSVRREALENLIQMNFFCNHIKTAKLLSKEVVKVAPVIYILIKQIEMIDLLSN